MTNCNGALKYYGFARIREEAMLMRHHHFFDVQVGMQRHHQSFCRVVDSGCMEKTVLTITLKVPSRETYRPSLGLVHVRTSEP